MRRIVLQVFAGAVIPLGFAIGGLTRLVLKGLFYLFSKHAYETVLRDDQLIRLWAALSISAKRDRSNELPALRQFINGLHEKAYEQLDRYWNASAMYAGGVTALAIAALLVYFYEIYPPRLWWVLLVSLAAVFFLIAWNIRAGLRREIAYYLDRHA